MTRGGYWLNFGIVMLGVVVVVPLAGFFGYKWLTTDLPDRSYACGAGSRGSGTCYSGETANMVLTLVFSGAGLVGIVLAVIIARAARRAR